MMRNRHTTPIALERKEESTTHSGAQPSAIRSRSAATFSRNAPSDSFTTLRLSAPKNRISPSAASSLVQHGQNGVIGHKFDNRRLQTFNTGGTIVDFDPRQTSFAP